MSEYFCYSCFKHHQGEPYEIHKGRPICKKQHDIAKCAPIGTGKNGYVFTREHLARSKAKRKNFIAQLKNGTSPHLKKP